MLDFPKKRNKTPRLWRNTQQQVSFHILRSLGIIHVKYRVTLYLVFVFPKGQYESKYGLKSDNLIQFVLGIFNQARMFSKEKNIYVCVSKIRPIGKMVRMFANRQVNQDPIPVRHTKKWCLIFPCFWIIRNLSRVSWAIKEKVQCPPLYLGLVTIEKVAFGSSSTMVGQIIYIYIYIYNDLIMYHIH